jgi:NAD+ synthase (glutamine-hydrolysing)
VDLILVVNASPFAEGKFDERLDHLKHRASVNQVPIAYVNLVGGQDELIFDGGSLVVDRDGEIIAQATFFAEDRLDVVWDGQHLIGDRVEHTPSDDALLYQALVTGVRDYFSKTGFRKAVLGLSGGIDSALTLAVAVDALGADNVHAVMMPYLYTADISVTDAKRQAEILGCEFSIVPIEPMVREFMQTLAPFFDGHPVDTTEENLQSRCRGVLLMALSNKTGALVLTTGNKSEMAVGYATLYGDMAGGFAVLKDVWKTRVYDLARFVNRATEVIPERVIVRPPSAELAPGQEDSDSLPPYDRLDTMLSLYIESDVSPDEIIDAGFDPVEVKRMCRLVDINEYKRRQSAVGPRVTVRGFGRDRRYPIANRWSF